MRLATLPVVLLCASPYLLAQDKPKPSPEIDQALRNRASQFMQFTIDRAFSKAYALVADESKDWYLSSGKPQYTKFSIKEIEYSQDSQNATVMTTVTRLLSMQGREMPSEIVVADLWKMEDGKWMWIHDPDILETPIGPVRINRSAPSHADSVPKDISLDAAIRKTGDFKQAVTADKDIIAFVPGAAGQEQVVIHNGFPGEVEVDLDIVGDYASYKVEPTHAQLRPDQEIVLKVSYKPVDRLLVSFLRIRVEPFNRTITLPIKLSVSSSAPRAPAGH